MLENPRLFVGNSLKDHRGEILFNNDFDLTEVKRFYQINSPKDFVRAWQGHQAEKKWFRVVSGSFEIKLIHFDFNQKRVIKKEEFLISEIDNSILFIPGGYLNGFMALTSNSKLLVYSNFNLESSKNDDFRFSLEQITW